MYIEPTRLLKNSIPNVKFDRDRKFRTSITGLDWSDSVKIEETITVNKYNNIKEKDL